MYSALCCNDHTVVVQPLDVVRGVPELADEDLSCVLAEQWRAPAIVYLRPGQRERRAGLERVPSGGMRDLDEDLWMLRLELRDEHIHRRCVSQLVQLAIPLLDLLRWVVQLDLRRRLLLHDS